MSNTDRWSALSMKDKADLIKLFIENGILSLDEMKKQYNADINRAVDANEHDFVRRLNDKNAPSIVNLDGSISTHSMASGEIDGKGIVFPTVQTGDSGKLRRYSVDKALDRAIQTNDTLQMHPAIAPWYAKNYKQFYNTFDKGGKARQRMYNSVKDRIVQEAQAEQMATQPKMGEQSLKPLEYDIVSNLTNVGDIELGNEVISDLASGNLTSAAVTAVAMFLPNILGKKLIKSVARAKNIERTVEPKTIRHIATKTDNTEAIPFFDAENLMLQQEELVERLNQPSKLSDAERKGKVKAERNQVQKKKTYGDKNSADAEKTLKYSEITGTTEIPYTLKQIEEEVDQEVKENMIRSRRKGIERINDRPINYLDDEKTVQEFRERLSDYVKTIQDIEPHPAFRTIDFDGERLQSPSVRAYRRYLVQSGVDADGISDDDLARVLTKSYQDLVNNQTGKAKGTLLFHGSPTYFDKFDLTKVGTNTGNVGAVGPGFYFTNYGANYDIKRNPFGIGTIENNFQPYLISGIKSTPDGSMMIQKGILPKYEGTGIFQDKIDDAIQHKYPTMLFSDFSERVPGRYEMSGYKSGFMYRGDNIKSVFPHPSMFERLDDGTVILKQRTFDKGKLNYKNGGNLFDWGGKFPVSRYEDRPNATFEETLMIKPPEITKQKITPKYIEKDRKQYTVQTGDSLSKIAKQNDVPLDSLLSFNPQIKNPNVIHTGDNIYLERQEFEKPKEIKDIRETRQLESQLSSKEAIMAATHKSNYAIIDKDAQKIEVYNPQGELLGKVDTITGQSNLDYNTKTYTDSKGELIDMQGNNSTPAGITEITSTGSYHGVPSFQRSRVGNDDKVKKTKTGEADTIASALHFEHGVGTGKNRSNGCVRLSTEGAQALGQMLGVGDRIYTLPQQEGSRFVLRDGKLSFIADNVFGKDETSADTTKVNGQIKSKADWDDYNVTVNRTYSPLKIVTQQTGEKEYDSNVKTFSTSLENNKESLMKNLGLSSYEYNTLAMLAMGIAQQESKFGTSAMYKLKNLGVTIGNKDINVQKAVKDIVGNNSYDSQGIGQIKYKGDNEDAQKMYKKAGVTENHNDISNEAKGIVARLAHIYKNQYLGKSKLFENAGISTEEALAFLYNGGKVSEIKNAVENNENIRDLVHSVPDGAIGRITGKTKLVSTLDYANKVLSNMSKFKFLGEY